jgi:ubiquinone/menaquinone biosynthesis C-methylase UbiE
VRADIVRAGVGGKTYICYTRKNAFSPQVANAQRGTKDILNNMKDNFSQQAQQYARFRPHYPPELFAHILSLVAEKNTAWDGGTGNGQVASVLATHFTSVFATDISAQQLEHAIQLENIHYSLQPAEKTNFHDAQFDLVTVAQAIHWFRVQEFYTEVKRTLKPGGLIAIIGYGLLHASQPLQQLIDHFYYKIVGPYWDAERRYIDEKYQTIPFPFQEIPMPFFQMDYDWTLEQLLGYINTWSAVKHYEKQQGVNPVNALAKELGKLWQDQEVQTFSFPLLLRVGRNNKN